MNLLSFFGIDAQLQKLRTAASEGALAVEDRFQLARMEWDEEKTRLKLLLALALGLLGQTVVTLTIASFALIVQYWDAPYRATAAWTGAAVWLVLWSGLALGIAYLLYRGSVAFGPTREELGKDWMSLKADIHPDGRKTATPDRVREPRPVDKEALLQRIALQRERLARSNAAAATAVPAPQQATAITVLSATADPEFPRSMTVRTLRDHPVASVALVGGAVAVVAAMGPKRAARMASWVLPLLLPRR